MKYKIAIILHNKCKYVNKINNIHIHSQTKRKKLRKKNKKLLIQLSNLNYSQKNINIYKKIEIKIKKLSNALIDHFSLRE
jgi:hypothetical protein